MRPDLFIEVIRSSNPYSKQIYLKGNCYSFFKILQSKYPEAEAYYDGDHVITKIEDTYYDITGKVVKVNHLRMTQSEQDKAEDWSKDFKLNIRDMLNKTTIENIATALGLKAEDLTAKITSEKEETLEIPEGQYFTEDQLSSRDTSKYKEGKDAGVEMLVKDAKKKYGYEYEGKDIDSLLEFHRKETESKFSKTKDEWQTANEQQQKAYEAELLQIKTEKEQLENKFKTQRVNNKLLSLMPKETTIKNDAIITLFNSEYSVIEEDGNQIVVKGDTRLIDAKSTEPLTIDKVFNDFIVNEGYAKTPSGRGGDNETGSGSTYTAKTPESFQDEWSKKNPGKSTQSADYMKDYAAFREQQSA